MTLDRYDWHVDRQRACVESAHVDVEICQFTTWASSTARPTCTAQQERCIGTHLGAALACGLGHGIQHLKQGPHLHTIHAPGTL